MAFEEDSSGYRSRKVDFVSNFGGSSALTVCAVCATSLTTHALWSSLPTSAKFVDKPSTVFIVDFCTTVLPWILVTTVFPQTPGLFNVFCLICAWFIKAWFMQRRKHTVPPRKSRDSNSGVGVFHGNSTKLSSSQGYHRHTASADNEQYTLSRSPSLPDSSPSFDRNNNPIRQPRPLPARLFTKSIVSIYRAQLLLFTAICILAVDFPAFPRQFAKCETWGTSVMDLGVGSFVFSFGLVSVMSTLRSRVDPTISKSVRSAFRRGIPLLTLGVVRLLAVKISGYHEHVSEYGVHWNFFFTMGCLPLLAAPLRHVSTSHKYWIAGLCVSLVHEFLLQKIGMQSWVLSSRRSGILSANKEGITSLPGYVAIYMLGADTGLYVLPPDPYFAFRDWKSGKKTPFKPKPGKLAAVLAGYSALWWSGYLLAREILKIVVSRRLANLTYVLWIIAMNVTALLALLIVQLVSKPPGPNINDTRTEVPLLLEAINHHGMLFFIVANVATGLINMSMDTLTAGRTWSSATLVCYSAALCLVIRKLDVDTAS